MADPWRPDDLARELGVTRHPWMVIPCSGCGVICRPVQPLECFCVRCVAGDIKRAGQHKRPDQGGQ